VDIHAFCYTATTINDPVIGMDFLCRRNTAYARLALEFFALFKKALVLPPFEALVWPWMSPHVVLVIFSWIRGP
jgi:hypothetical protein